MKDKIIEISKKLERDEITEKDAQKQLLDLIDVSSMLPSEEEIIKHSEYTTDFWQRNGRDMSSARYYFCIGADMVKRHFMINKGDKTVSYTN